VARIISGVYIVEDSPSLASALAAALSQRATAVAIVSSAEEARRGIVEARPELVILDVALPDGTAFDVLDGIRELLPAPAVIAMSGSATAEQSFRLAEYGVREYLAKPVAMAALHAAIDSALSKPPNLMPILRAAVGRASLSAVEEEVRATMVREAMARTGGSRRGAAKILSVSRQVLQHILRKSV
jgi:two-component system, response regulator RegA